VDQEQEHIHLIFIDWNSWTRKSWRTIMTEQILLDLVAQVAVELVKQDKVILMEDSAPGGAGLTNSITGSHQLLYAGGGGGGNRLQLPAGSGGPGGGGNGSNSHQIAADAGSVNTGGGGGAEGYNNQPPGNPYNVLASGGGAGGSGIIVLKVPSAITGTFSPGVTQTLSTSVPGFNIYTVTATSTSSETVKFRK
jgi:hypothetical protein